MHPIRLGLVMALAGLGLTLLSLSAAALVTRLTTIPVGRGSATITWTGSAGITPTINSIKGTAGGYQVSGSGRVPISPSNDGTGASISVPSELPIADVTGTIGGAHFTLDIVLTFPASITSNKTQSFGHITGTFRNQQVRATITANIKSRSFGFRGTIGTLHVAGVVSQPVQHKNTETAHATFNVTK